MYSVKDWIFRNKECFSKSVFYITDYVICGFVSWIVYSHMDCNSVPYRLWFFSYSSVCQRVLWFRWAWNILVLRVAVSASSCYSDKMKYYCSCCKLMPLLLQNSSSIYIQPLPFPCSGGPGELKVLIHWPKQRCGWYWHAVCQVALSCWRITAHNKSLF